MSDNPKIKIYDIQNDTFRDATADEIADLDQPERDVYHALSQAMEQVFGK